MLSFSTKADTLRSLADNVTKSRVLPQVSFTARELLNNPDEVLSRVMQMFSGITSLVVRSSAVNEDTEKKSNAGKYLSILDVGQSEVIESAMKVFDSYGGTDDNNQILVQPMLQNVTMSGVLFTVDPNTGGNYFVINYDDKTGSTSSITSGNIADPSTCYIFHGRKIGETRLDALVDAANEIMDLFSYNMVDIEFAFADDDIPFIIQARPLVMRRSVADYKQQCVLLERAHNFITRGMGTHPYAQGNRTVYGVMPDWNPAEMIGIRPKPLASSLYRRLITDGTWAYQRNEYGYKNLRSFPLMLEFCGLPYIDVRISFNSFIPKDIDNELSEKLVNYYLDSLIGDPNKHDKVEFEIVFSCNTFDLPKRLSVLAEHSFTQEDIDTLRNSLRRLTNNIINTADGLWIVDTEKIDILDKRREIIISSDMDDISKIYWLMADCTRYGTLPFAGLARAGFVAIQLLKSLVSMGIISDKEYQNYLGGLNTISSQMTTDRQELSKTAFLRKYGHLRPGTYDITSMRYDMAPEKYFSNEIVNVTERDNDPFVLSIEQYAAIQNEMGNQKLDGDVLALFKFIKAGIEGREYAKFIFTKSLSHVLELIAGVGESYGFSRDEMAYLDYFLLDKLYSSTTDVRGAINDSIADGKRRYDETVALTMPPVILNPDDIYAFHLPSGTPNYITLGEISGDVCTDDLSNIDISDKILLISAADPGYDWIFSHNIRGFITAYGGANSHMAIRAGELGIPAVIGVGEKVYNQLKSVESVQIDCLNKKINILK